MHGELVASARDAYRTSLQVGPVQTGRQFFLCPVGLVGAGKTTVIKPLSERLSLVRISHDEVRQMLKARGLGYQFLMDIVQPLARELAGEGYRIAFDADCGNPQTKNFRESGGRGRSESVLAPY